ncbi:MFS transporter [Microlunatus soli]|uniref:Predicted arabinose efflux permease, MFS family n=1 Tax=Microlunatus soli TaxID=630515 RepID=A0A1H1T8M1_9ACTN|nr:MFS transporter [Microlunatus soli]SDS56504.1 Predicted arabinose efflux permease, MFS family [Microlunatus soli]
MEPNTLRSDRTAVRSAWPWIVAGAAFATLVAAAGFRSVPGVLMQPLQDEFGWGRGTIGLAVSVNLVLYGLFAPFAAALMERFGVRRVAATALLAIAVGSGAAIFVTQAWQLILLWGFVVGLGSGAMAMSFAALIIGRWFVRRAGLVSGVLTAGGSTGQLIFLPLLSRLNEQLGWRPAALLTAGAALLAVLIVVAGLRNRPSDVDTVPWGAAPDFRPAPVVPQGSVGRAFAVLGQCARRPAFWLLVGGFAICGMTTNGLIQTHFVSAAHDHGMPQTTAAGLLALVGIFDIVGTVASGMFSDRVDPRVLLLLYYALRGMSLFALPGLFGPHVEPPMWAFIIFYGLDWVATVPPTMALCRREFGESAPIAFGWIFASHQLGAAIAATGAGLIRDRTGDYRLAWWIAGSLCVVAALMSIMIARNRERAPALIPARD